MIGIEYNYNHPKIIIDSISIIQDYGIIEYIILGLLFMLFIIILQYILPIAYIYNENLKKEKQKLNRKMLIKQIAMQKDIEDEIEKELGL